jgi:serine phosphatase RsbU (regulator of sigma subunit)
MAPAAEAAAGAQQQKPCRHCGGPVEPPRRRNVTKDFCCDRHRAAFRDAQVAAAVMEAQRVVVDARAAIEATRQELERLEARLTGAEHLLQQAVPRRLRGLAR